MTDSIKIDMNNLSFEYYGIQRIERETSILKRQLVTTGKLRHPTYRTRNIHSKKATCNYREIKTNPTY